MTTEVQTELAAGGISPAFATFRAFIGDWNVGFTVGADATDAELDAVLSRAGYVIRALKAKDCKPAYGFAGPHGQGVGHAGANGHAAPATNGNGQAATGDAAGVTDAEWITVNVPKDGKIRVEFWRTGREYAEENVVRTAEQLAPLLEAIGLTTAPGEHKPLPVRVHWTRGRERQNKDGTPSGKYYHDVTRLELLPPA